MEYGQNIGNMTDYFVNPCPYTISYYAKQINDALKQAFKENPRWINPGSRKEVIHIIDEIREWYNPFLYTGLISSTFDRLWHQAMNELLNVLNEKVPKVKQKKNNSKLDKDRIGQCYDPVKLENVIDRLREQGMSLKTIGNLSGVHFTTISHMKKGTGPYWRKRVTASMNMLINFFESLGIDTEDLIIINDAESHSEAVKSNKSFCGGPGGGFYKKSPLAAGGKKGGNHE